MRICSLLPSATEIVAELGLVESLVGISEECDWPPEVGGLPVVTASRVETTHLTSLEIDGAVREAVGDGRPLYAIDRELLETLQPDLILTQNLCAVCAVSADNVNELCATDAEVVAPCGFDHTRAAREATLPPLACRAVAVDSNAYYARPAPRLADGIAQLAFLIHPDLVNDPGLPYLELATPTPPGPAILGDVAR